MDTENSKQLFPEKELWGLSPNFHIDLSVSDLYIPRIGPHISYSRIGMGIHKSRSDTWMWKLGLRPHNTIPFLGIFFSNFRYYFFAVCIPSDLIYLFRNEDTIYFFFRNTSRNFS